MAAAAAAHSDRYKCGFVNMILIIMIAVLAVGMIALIVIYFSYLPYTAEFAVTDASLTEYNLTTNNNRSTLHYDLDLNFTVQNSNKDYGICHEDLQVMAYYQKNQQAYYQKNQQAYYQKNQQGYYQKNQQAYYQKNQHLLGIGNLASFYQGKKNTTHLTLSLKLGQLRLDHVLCNHDGAISYHDIDVMLHVRNRYKAKYTWKGNSDIICQLEVPLISYNSSDNGSQSANTSTSNFYTTCCYSEENFPGFPMIFILPGIFFVLCILSFCLFVRVPK